MGELIITLTETKCDNENDTSPFSVPGTQKPQYALHTLHELTQMHADTSLYLLPAAL